jgi:hypothetical protein
MGSEFNLITLFVHNSSVSPENIARNCDTAVMRSTRSTHQAQANFLASFAVCHVALQPTYYHTLVGTPTKFAGQKA